MTLIKKTFFSLATLAMAALIVVPNNANAASGDVGAGKIINTSPLWADSTASYHACNAVNVTTSPATVSIALLNNTGTVLQSFAYTVAAGGSVELSNNGNGYTGFARCRFTVSNQDFIRANISVFHWTGTYFDTLATDSAR